jgi:chromosome segregation ATPase
VIGFNCQHCNHPLQVADNFAGQDGWCRACKRLVVVPSADGSMEDWSNLSPNDQASRLEKILHRAASKADRLRSDFTAHAEALRELSDSDPPAESCSITEKLSLLVEELRERMGAMRESASAAAAELEGELASARAEQLALTARLNEALDDLKKALDAAPDTESEALRESLQSENAELRDTLMAREGDVAALSEGIEAAERRHEEDVAAHALASGQLDALREELNSTGDAGRTASAKLDKLGRDSAEAQALAGAAKAEAASLRAKLDELGRDSAEAQALAGAAKAEAASLRAKLDELGRDSAEALEVAGAAKAEAASLRAQLDEALAESQTCRTASEEAEKQGAALAKVNEALRDELEKATTEASAYDSRVSDLEKEMLGAETNLQSTAETQTALQGDLNQRDTESEELRASLTVAKKGAAKAEKRTQSLEKKAEAAREKLLKKLATETARSEGLKNEVESMRGELLTASGAHERVGVLEEEVSQLRDALDAAAKDGSRTETLERELSGARLELEGVVAALVERGRDLQAERAALLAVKSAKGDSEKRLAEIEDRARILNEDLLRARDEGAAREAELGDALESLRVEEEAAANRREALEEELHSAEARIEQLAQRSEAAPRTGTVEIAGPGETDFEPIEALSWDADSAAEKDPAGADPLMDSYLRFLDSR